MRWILAAGVAALMLAAAGCGGSSDSGSEAAADTVTTETVSTDTAASTEQSTTDTTSTDSTSTDSSGSIAGLSGDCQDLIKASEKYSAAIASSAGGTDADLSTTAEAFKEFADKAPDELKDDFQVLADVMAKYAAALKDLDFKPGEVPTPDQIAKLTKLGQSLNAADVQKASQAISAWSTANCGSTP